MNVANYDLLIKWDTCLDIEINSKFIELLNVPKNQSQLNIKLAFNFQQHFNLIVNWRQLKKSNLNLSCIEKWTCGTSSIQFKILTHQLAVHVKQLSLNHMCKIGLSLTYLIFNLHWLVKTSSGLIILKTLSYILNIWSTARLEISLPNGWWSFFYEKSAKSLHKPYSEVFWNTPNRPLNIFLERFVGKEVAMLQAVLPRIRKTEGFLHSAALLNSN
jgi:hypothetical protein